MIGFLVKKTFFDLWDNVLRIALLNMGFLASVAIPVFLPSLVSIQPLSWAVFSLGVLWCFVYLSTAALSLKAVSDYGSFGFSDFFRNLKAALPAGLFLGAVALLFLAMASFVIPFYLEMNSLFGLFLASVIFWAMALGAVALQFFFSIRARLDTKLSKVFRKCFIIFFDNAGFSIFSLLYNAVMLAVSGLLAFLFPGPAGILLYLDEALRLRLLKYDWLEVDSKGGPSSKGGENPEAEPGKKRRTIPWDVILIEEREKTGSRTLKNFIFPWKD
jgi:hypothetical protein